MSFLSSARIAQRQSLAAFTCGAPSCVRLTLAASRSASVRALSISSYASQKQQSNFSRWTPHSTSPRRVRHNSTTAGAAEKLDEGEQKIFDLLKQRFSPAELKVQDVSGGCGSFYAILVSSKDFAGIPTVKAHRLVNETLKEVIPGIHGLQVKTVAET